MNDSMLPLPGLSPVCGKTVVAKFDGGLLSSDAGILVLHEVEQRLRVADRLAACMVYRQWRLGWFLQQAKGPRNIDLEPQKLAQTYNAFAPLAFSNLRSSKPSRLSS